MSFKIGDKVRRNDQFVEAHKESSGTVVTVSVVDGQWLKFKEDVNDKRWYSGYYELVN